MPVKILAIVIPAVLVVSLGVIFGLKYLNESMEQGTLDPTPQPPQSQIIPEVKNPQINLITATTPTANGINLDIGFSPLEPNQPVVAMAFRLNMSQPAGPLRASTTSPTINPAIKNTDWNFPFAKLEPQADGSINLDISAVHLSTGPFVLDANTTWLTIPLESPADNLIITIDPTESKFMDIQAKPLHFIQEGVAQTL